MDDLDQLLKDLEMSSGNLTATAPSPPVTTSSGKGEVKKIGDLMNELQENRSSLNSLSDGKKLLIREQDSPLSPELQLSFNARGGADPAAVNVPESAHKSLEKLIGGIPGANSRAATMLSQNGAAGEPVGVCAGCNGTIYSLELAVTAIGNQYHQEHFTCKNCFKSLSGGLFFEKGGFPYCETCMNETFLLPKCAFCNENIKGKCINALDKHWHPDHFFCSQCGKHFPAGTGFLEKDGKAYCEEDYFNMFAPKCATCDLPIMDEVVSALGKSFHLDCFVCAEPGCKLRLSDSGSFFDHNGKQYCETHYHAARGSLCASCQKPIVGRCLTAIGKKFHPEHFVCAFCKKQLGTNGVANTSTFKDHDGKPYCTSCHVKLYG